MNQIGFAHHHLVLHKYSLRPELLVAEMDQPLMKR